MAESLDFSDRVSVLGRTEAKLAKYGDRATAYIGKVVMSGGQNPVLGRKILMDLAEPHVVLICGKRGGGKSYDVAILIEEFARQTAEIKSRISVIAIDTVGIFWTLKIPNAREKEELADWDLKPDSSPVRVLVPKGRLDFYQQNNIPVDGAFTLKVSELDGVEWLALFHLTWKDKEGVLLTRIVEDIKEKMGTYYGLDDLIKMTQQDTESDDLTKSAVIGRLQAA
ncbi:MAG: hypothetical protein Q7R47_01905, partial [Candidatus Diapherotrites archaeon]|nr:hypothetical protein [Candidatus Diapherotrites archaeon]